MEATLERKPRATPPVAPIFDGETQAKLTTARPPGAPTTSGGLKALHMLSAYATRARLTVELRNR